MSISATTDAGTVTVFGVRETLRELRRVDPELRRRLQRDLRGAAEPMRSAIIKNIPAAAPLSGLASWWARPHRVGIRTGGRAKWGRDTIPLIRLQVRARGPVMVDMARVGRTPQGRALIRNIGGSASRYVYPAVESAMPATRRAVLAVCERIVSETDRRLLQIGGR